MHFVDANIVGQRCEEDGCILAGGEREFAAGDGKLQDLLGDKSVVIISGSGSEHAAFDKNVGDLCNDRGVGSQMAANR